MHISKASFAVGQYCPVSIELIEFLDTPIISARVVWEIFLSVRIFFRWFFSFNCSFTSAPPYYNHNYVKQGGSKR